ncbi:MAG: hypothetical protein PHY94_01180 [Candidatus Omnitrophica bacterium]|nr:hypothetical protein [Candidatus Omnitrophota bacterium]
MEKGAKLFFSVTLFIFSVAIPSFAQGLDWEDLSSGNRDARAVLLNPDNAKIIYFASKNQVFETSDAGKNWKMILTVKGKNSLVNFLSFYPLNRGWLYVATQGGLFFSNNQGRSWQKIFRGKGYLENDCTTLMVLPDCIYLGTKAGLFLSKNNGRQWEKISGKLGLSQIFSLTAKLKEPGSVYAACADGAFRTKDSGKSWERIFVKHESQAIPEEEPEDDTFEEEENPSQIRFISLDPLDSNILYLASSMGVYQSQDKGGTWAALSDYGLLSKEAQYLYLSAQANLYLVTKSGIFEYESSRWHEISFGLSFKEIRFLTQDDNGNFYVACDSGIFKSKVNIGRTIGRTKVKQDLYYPTIRQVQEAAIKYADVEPKKIIRWRKQAAKRAYFPKVSAGVNRDTGDLWHWESGSSTKAGDDYLMKGRDSVGWDVTLTWDLAEIIWSDAQTSIDTRSRLTVQLREDVLDEVTKIYFERIRLIRDLDNLSLEDRQKREEKELRLEELSAYLDGLTGGYFLKEVKKVE